MSEDDKRLGMHRTISRRDFLGGLGISAGAAALIGNSPLLRASAAETAPYPPALTGMRGAHPGSFETAHALVQGKQWPATASNERYDLIVVGAGISGLSAAYLYRRDVKPDARILILDNHDDFGGHAKRNEFTIGGKTIIGFGGTMLMEAPASYPTAARRLISELGIDADSYGSYHHGELFESLGMGSACFLAEETFGRDTLVRSSQDFSPELEGLPMGKEGKADMARLFADEEDYLAGMSPTQRRQVLQKESYGDYLRSRAGMGEEVIAFMQKRSHGVWCIGADALPALIACASDYPGFAGMDLGYPDSLFGPEDDSIFHFPDGNATIARLLVRTLVPGVAPGNTMEDVVTAPFDYSRLDRENNETRIRLNSTVTHMAHREGALEAEVDITYVEQGRTRAVTAGSVVWAGYQAMVPYLCPDIPQAQEQALASCARSPLVYTNVLIRNWRSLEKLGAHDIYCPASFFQRVRLDFPVSMGDYRFATSPDEPVLLHLQHMPLQPGLAAEQQFEAGRRALLTTSFDSFERNARAQLGRMLGPGGFDPAEDIAAITVNRWPHGYAFSADPASGEIAWWPELWENANRPWEASRRRVGNIAFAGIDAASNAMTEAAIEEADRAVQSLHKKEGEYSS